MIHWSTSSAGGQPDREDGGGDPFCSGRFAGRDGADHSRLDIEIIERAYLEIPRLRTVVDKAPAVDHAPSVIAATAVVDIIRDAIRSVAGN